MSTALEELQHKQVRQSSKMIKLNNEQLTANHAEQAQKAYPKQHQAHLAHC